MTVACFCGFWKKTKHFDSFSRSGDCTFENGMCTWRNTRREDNFDWLQGKGQTLSGSTGPSTDHSTGSANGTYMYIETSAPRRPGDKARLLSQFFDTVPARGRCLTFWYHMFGAQIGTLNVLWKSGPGNASEILIWSLTSQQGNQWLFAKVPVPRKLRVRHYFVFEGIRGSGYRGDIAIDDIQFKTGACAIEPAKANPNQGSTTASPTTAFTLPPTIPASQYNCDFEKDKCAYVDESLTDVFNWTRQQGHTSSGGTGPGQDHTKLQGVVGPKGPGSLQQLNSAKCIHVYLGGFTKPSPGTTLVYYRGCGQERLEFALTSDGYWQMTKFKACLQRRGGGGQNADDVVFGNTCSEKWQLTAKGSMQHAATKKCVMPLKNYVNPPDDTKLVLTTSCDRSNQLFRWQPSKCD